VSPRSLYSRLALAEVVTWTLLLLGMAAKYGLGQDWATSVAGGVHGFVFLSYCMSTVAVWIDRRWPAGTGVLGLLSAVVPFCTLPFERSVEHRGLLTEGPWRLGPGGDAPRGPAEKLLATALRAPLVAVLVAVVVVAVVFGLLLMAGPPTEWFS